MSVECPDFHSDPTVARVTPTGRLMTEQFSWCRGQIGESGESWYYDLYTNTYYFRDSRIAVLFKLKWA